MAAFGTVEWWKTLSENLNADEDFRDEASDFTFDFLFIVGDMSKTVFNFVNGEVVEVREAVPGDEEKQGYIVEATYDLWKEIQTGKTKAELALIKNQLKLTKGSKMHLVKQLGPAGGIFVAMKAVPDEA